MSSRSILHLFSALDLRTLNFTDCLPMTSGVMHVNRDVVSDRAVGFVLGVVSALILQLISGIRKAHEVAIGVPLVLATMAARTGTPL